MAPKFQLSNLCSEWKIVENSLNRCKMWLFINFCYKWDIFNIIQPIVRLINLTGWLIDRRSGIIGSAFIYVSIGRLDWMAKRTIKWRSGHRMKRINSMEQRERGEIEWKIFLVSRNIVIITAGVRMILVISCSPVFPALAASHIHLSFWKYWPKKWRGLRTTIQCGW